MVSNMIEIVEREYEIEGTVKLRVVNPNGDVKVKGYKGSTLKLKAEKVWDLLSAEPKVRVKREGELFIIEASSSKTFGKSYANLHLLVPEIVVEEIKSVNGDVLLKNVRVKTVKTVNGDITAENSRIGTVESVSGDITIERSCISTAKTISGDVSINFAEICEDVFLATKSGDIEVAVPRSANATIMVKTKSGDISSEIKGDFKKGMFLATLGSGKHKLKIATISGDVRIRLI